MPETLIAIVALIGAAEGAEDVAIGAIVGAPFLLATLAMGLVGLFAYLYRERREQGLELKAAPADPRARPGLLPRLLRARAGARLGGAGRRCGSRSGSLFLLAYLVYIAAHPARRRRGAGRGDAQPADLRAARRAPRRPRRWRSA